MTGVCVPCACSKHDRCNDAIATTSCDCPCNSLGVVKDRHWHLITDDELAALLGEHGCTRVEELVEGRDTDWGETAIQKELSRPSSED